MLIITTSEEYAKIINPKNLVIPMITIEFKQIKMEREKQYLY